ncbi:enoyl-CoA hydratase-related protein [Micromonospora endophytica]|uniref:enoyl-CoA hydratase n=1 Tax=Micromonospora endophytica TaxID=515350 RepID=A0A2W2C2C0_9ACTN|nr:enoyl-CoA hydratase-related protein [Micromonospora endophytica]PZF93715.1 enoyl-CoA hydratase [Micromonospora endophytica]RIW41765.1 enoyl-CoA hydratase [Micromonospora endophytica]BCJ62966.1 putative enoyl-CoA hydratase echA8 [Micromonospora endophytica]
MRITIEKNDRVVTVTLCRPEVRNALDTALLAELVDTLRPLDQDPEVGCFVITGSEQAFAAGADIREMAGMSFLDAALADHFAGWDAFAALRTPKIAAVAGYALGGGCELAMMCDLIFAAENARFGQPELRLGVMPGIGGTQRLTRLIGRARAMDLILTGRQVDAVEAERFGLVSRVVPADRLLTEARLAAATVAGHSKLATLLAREAVDQAAEVGLSAGVLFERRSCHALFATEDRQEGMRAFLEKRPARFTGR